LVYPEPHDSFSPPPPPKFVFKCQASGLARLRLEFPLRFSSSERAQVFFFSPFPGFLFPTTQRILFPSSPTHPPRSFFRRLVSAFLFIAAAFLLTPLRNPVAFLCFNRRYFFPPPPCFPSFFFSVTGNTASLFLMKPGGFVFFPFFFPRSVPLSCLSCAVPFGNGLRDH